MKTDLQIQRDVIEELKWDPSLNASDIGVAVKEGVVTLSGYVENYREKRAAENAALRITGVKAVAENIVVKLVAKDKKNDTEIARAIVNALEWNTSVKNETIKIKVEDGWVTLTGDVEWKYQVDTIKATVESIHGVNGISNLINITPGITAKDIKRKIKDALHRRATIDASRIGVETIGNRVILSGRVRSYAERNDAENAAWSIPGIKDVENKLEISVSADALVEY